jgi:hypothetical protein
VVLRELAGPEPTAGTPKPGKPGGPNTPQIAHLHQMLVRLCGDQDVTVLPGLADHTLLSLVGGTTSGYSLTGRRNMASKPIRKMIAETTPAKIGRRMKKWEKFMSRGVE